MKKCNLSKGTMYFPLKDNEEVVNGAIYEIVSGKAQKLTSDTITGTVLGVCAGGGNMRPGEVMLDIDPTSVFEEAYTDSAPTIGEITGGCKLVIGVDTVAKTFTYLIRTAAGGSEYVLPTASADTLGGVKIGAGLTITEGVLSVSTASADTLGGIKVGTGLTMTEGVLSVSGE